MDKEGRQRLRAVVRGGDAAAIMAALDGRDVESCPQVTGDALVLAVAGGMEPARQLALRCVSVLRERDWEGDAELADQLSTVLDPEANRAPRLDPVTVDLDDVIDALRNNDPRGGGRLNLHTGEVILTPPFDAFDFDMSEDEDADDQDGWLAIDALGSRPGYRDMERFIATCHEARTVDLLSRAIRGKGAFRRFRVVLEAWPELENRWYRYDEERWRGRAREWLADAGYQPAHGAVRASPDP